MFKKLLVPLDGSALAEQALGQAAAIARAASAAIDVTLVHDIRPSPGSIDLATVDLFELEKTEREYVATIAGELASGGSLTVTHAVVNGEPVDAICRRIWDQDIDLVVLTSHGRTGFSRLWIGSVADGLVYYAGVPVMLLRPTNTKQREIAARHLSRQMLVPLDGSEESSSVLPAAGAYAECSGAHVQLLRIVQPPPLSLTAAGVPMAMPPINTDDAEMDRLIARANEWMAETTVAFRERYDVTVSGRVIVDYALAPAIIQFAKAQSIDLIAMATRACGLSRVVRGSVADKVLRGSELPMLLFHPEPAERRAEEHQYAAASTTADHSPESSRH